MKNFYKLFVTSILLIAPYLTMAQFSFSNANNRLMNSNFRSGCPVAVADFNNDGLDDIIRLDQGHILNVELQRPNNTFENILLGDFAPGAGSGWAWAMCVADVDHNGYLDVVAGESGPAVRIFMTNNTGTGGTFVDLPQSGYFVQNMTFGDFNNDGWVDLFACDDNAQSHIYLNDGTGTLVISTTIMNFNVTSTDDSGNYGSAYTDIDNDGDLDLYIAKCRQFVNDSTDGRRINVLFINNGNGTYTEEAAARGIASGRQTWTASFGDIDNDGDMDLMIANHDLASQIFENDGNGYFTDITASTGFNISDITPIETVMEDFDNDGWIDIFAAGSDWRLWKNNGNGTFTNVTGLFNSDDIESFATGDLNHDGFIDIYASYADIYTNPSNTTDDVIWLNDRNDNNFITFDLQGTVSNIGAIGARVAIYGAWGIQIREVRAGESYGTANSAMVHFGLGQETIIDSAVITFPSGITQTLVNPVINQFINIIENDCVSPAVIVASAAPYLCTGQTLTLDATMPGSVTYLWNDGSTTPALVISQGGEYVVTVNNGSNCSAVSTALIITADPDQTPVISAAGETELCEGGTVTLNGPADAISYLWSNGDATQNTVITQSGDYVLTIQGYCQAFTSDTISVNIYSAADPVAADVNIPSPGTATLNATGNIINWYDVPTGGIPLATGPSFTTPVLTVNTTYYVDNTDEFNAFSANAGLNVPSGSNQFSGNTSNAETFFTVNEPCKLSSVKVYTDTPGMRRIQLKDNNGVVLNFLDVNILPDSQVVQLDFMLTPGTDYVLTTDGNTNNTSFGYVSPRLKRNSVNVNYPYDAAGLLTITGNNFGSQYFYYFYQWVVESIPLECTSARIPVEVTVGNVGLNELNSGNISIYPNPTDQSFTIKSSEGSVLQIELTDMSGKLVRTAETLSQINLNVEDIAAGMYILNIKQGDHFYQQKISIR